MGDGGRGLLLLAYGECSSFCNVPIFLLLACCLLGIILLITTVVSIVHYFQFKASLSRGRVEVKHFLAYSNTDATRNYDQKRQYFIISKPKERDQIKESSCPVCLRNLLNKKNWVLLGCNHGICWKCFKVLIQRQKINVSCPLCRGSIIQTIENDINSSTQANNTPSINEMNAV